MTLIKKYAFYGSAVVASLALALVLLVMSTPRTAQAAITSGAVTTTSVASGATATYTFAFTGSATTNITTATLTFPTAFTVPANPVVTVTGNSLACTIAYANSVSGVVTIGISGTCDPNTAPGAVVTVAGVVNPTVTTNTAYTANVTQSATAGFAVGTSLAADPLKAEANGITIGATTFSGASQVASASTTWTVTFTGSAATNITTATVGFPAGFTVPAAPTVTVTGAAACATPVAAATGSVGAGWTVSITGIAGACATNTGATITIAGITNPAAGATMAAAGFTVKTSLDTTNMVDSASEAITGSGLQLNLGLSGAGACSTSGSIATALGTFIAAPTAKADGSDAYSVCVTLADGNGAAVNNSLVVITSSIGYLSTGTGKVQNVFTSNTGVATTNYRGAGNVATTDTLVASIPASNTVAPPLSITLTAPSGTTASKITINAPVVLAVAAQITNTSPQYSSPTVATNVSLQVVDGSGLGVNNQQVQITVDKGGLVANAAFATTTQAALQGLCTATPARSIILTTLGTNLLSVGGTATAGTADFVYCTNQTDPAGKATITASNITTTMAPATLSLTTAGRPAKITTTQTGSSITATVVDSAGNVVADGTPVSFTISQNVGAVSNTCTTTTNGIATTQVALTGSTGAVIVTASWNEAGSLVTYATCPGVNNIPAGAVVSGSQNVSQTVSVAAGGAVTPGTPSTPTTPAAGAGSFAAAPVFSASKLANAVFTGTLSDATLTAAGATGAWAQDSKGNFNLYVVGAPAFVNAGFVAAFPNLSFTTATALTLVGK